LASLVLGTSCDKTEDPPKTPQARFVFELNPNQARLDNLGNPAEMPAGNAGVSPDYNGIAAHYIELTPTPTTLVGQGAVLYQTAETSAGGSNAILYDSLLVVASGGQFFEMRLKDIPPGTYNYIRVSLALQDYTIPIWHNNLSFRARLASFIGYQTYIGSYKIQDSSVAVNANRLQGYFGLETLDLPTGFNQVIQGQAPATTVPNPLAATSPIPAGSCLVTGAFETPLVVTGNETGNLTITVSLSTNRSFEWRDTNGNGRYEPLAGEEVVDMGIRGMVARWQK
jgi:hypothetical protein